MTSGARLRPPGLRLQVVAVLLMVVSGLFYLLIPTPHSVYDAESHETLRMLAALARSASNAADDRLPKHARDEWITFPYHIFEPRWPSPRDPWMQKYKLNLGRRLVGSLGRDGVPGGEGDDADLVTPY